MSSFLGSVWWMIVSLGVLVTFHEFGHYWVARRCGVRVLRFSVGFGKPLWMRRDRHGTEWAVAAIPLGGYVRMLGEHDLADRKTPVADEERQQSHDQKTVGQRMLISFAGPFANFVLCIALLWLMFVIGRPDYAPVVGQVDGIAVRLSPEYSDDEASRAYDGNGFSQDFLLSDVLAVDMGAETKLGCPLIVLAGRHDRSVNSHVAREWFDTVDAPYKHFEWFENSAHEILAEEPGKLLVTLVQRALPLASPQPAPGAERGGDGGPGSR